MTKMAIGDAAALEATTAAVTATRLLTVLEPASHALTACPRCDADRLGRWGTTRRGLQRWRCRGCGRTCTAATGTAIAHLHSLDKLGQVAADMLAETPRSCRALAAALDLDRMTVWRWRRLIADAWAGLTATHTSVASSPGADAVVTLRESRKASREWVRHQRYPACFPAPDRLRWVDYRQQRLPLPEPMSRYRVSVALQTRPSSDMPTISVGCTLARRGPSTGPTAQPARRFQDFLAPFAGPATRHLRTYVAWFQARVAGM
jgi:transposase-like protein